jgi:hypothetical protein
LRGGTKKGYCRQDLGKALLNGKKEVCINFRRRNLFFKDKEVDEEEDDED